MSVCTWERAARRHGGPFVIRTRRAGIRRERVAALTQASKPVHIYIAVLASTYIQYTLSILPWFVCERMVSRSFFACAPTRRQYGCVCCSSIGRIAACSYITTTNQRYCSWPRRLSTCKLKVPAFILRAISKRVSIPAIVLIDALFAIYPGTALERRRPLTGSQP